MPINDRILLYDYDQQQLEYQNNIQRIIKYQLEQQMSKNIQPTNCFLCSENVKQYTSLMAHSLYGKYSSSQNFYYGKEVDEILDEAISPAYIQFQDYNYYDDQQEYLKREYKHQQYSKKIQMLSQYYKFHRDLPTWNDRAVEGIMAKYYGRLKDVDYKRIKSILKKQQGISLTTHKSFSSFQDSQYTKKSRYSTMLNDLDHSNDSLVLRDVCEKIGKALKKVKIQNNFKGSYYSGEKKFQQFLRKQKKRKQNNTKKQQQNKKQSTFNFKKIKFNPKLNTKSDDVTGLKQIIYGSNHSLKDRKYAAIKNTISNQKTNQKTTGNQTISRQQKSKREKSKSVHPTSSRSSFSKKPSTSRDNFVSETLQSKFKSVKTFNVANIIHNNQNLRTINEIYKPTQKLEKKEKTSIQLTRKSSSKQLITRLKFRSNSHHNLPTASALNRDLSKKELMSSLKSNKSASKKSIPISVAKGSIIQLDGIHHTSQKSLQTARQNSHRILRTNSSDKLNNPSSFDKQYTTSKITYENKPFGKKRNSIVENMLEKKLAVFKRKQAVM